MKRYTVTDGKLVLTLEDAEEVGFIVRSPRDAAVITEAETISEAFEMARDAMAVLKEYRRGLRKVRSPSRRNRRKPKTG